MMKNKFVLQSMLILSILLSLQACNREKQEIGPTPESKAKKTPLVEQMLADYHKQEHRLAFNGCNIRYNEGSFVFGDSLTQAEKTLGRHENEKNGFYVWSDSNITLTSRDEKSMEILTFHMNKNFFFEPDENLYFLFNGVPINSKLKFKDFIYNSTYELSDFAISDHAYELLTKCPNNQKTISFYFSVEGGWNYKGGGHIYLKSTPNENNENTIKSLSVEIMDNGEN